MEGLGIATVITTAIEGLQAEAMTVIGSAIGLGVIFFGVRLLWSKFKGMAR